MKTTTHLRKTTSNRNTDSSSSHPVTAQETIKRISGIKLCLSLMWFFVFACLSIFNSHAQCVNAYQLNWSDASTYTVTCGTVVPAQWTVKRDSCNYYSPPIYVGGMIGEPTKVVSITVRINQSGNLTNNDFAWVFFTVNGTLRKMKVVRGDTVSAVFSYTDTVHVPAGGNLVIRIALKTDLNTEFWQIKNGDISGCISSTGTLPVEMLKFSISDSKGSALLNWTTASELNNDHFRIQRSTALKEYEDIGKVKGSGNSEYAINYVFNDLYPVAGYNYYRLVQVDFDGNETYYGPLVYKNLYKNKPISIFPNPVGQGSQTLTIENTSEVDEVMIHNSKGTLMKDSIQVERSDSGSMIHINGLDTGIYIVSVINKFGIHKSKLIVK